MISKSILFYWSKGSETRREMLMIIKDLNARKRPCFLNALAQKLKLTHVAVKKHLDILIEEGYIKPINPSGKPVYLELTDSGKKMVKELLKK